MKNTLTILYIHVIISKLLCIFVVQILLHIQVKDETLTIFFSPALLQKVLNPPDPDAVEDALESLVQIHALEKTSSGRYQPTFYGCLLNSLPLSFDSSVLTLKFCELGAVHEGILISIMLDIQPLPILQPFGYQVLVCFSCVMDHPYLQFALLWQLFPTIEFTVS